MVRLPVAVSANPNRCGGHAPAGIETHHALTENLGHPLEAVHADRKAHLNAKRTLR